jgi:membrane associated rhomboid family serine protease
MQESGKAPATIALGLLWVLVFAAMAAVQGRVPLGVYPFGGSILVPTSHRFGDLTPRGLLDGQVWRVITATFVHYSLLHLLLNLVGLIQLGRMVESWYGPGPLLGIYLVIGGLGNLVAGLARPWLDGRYAVHSGGGSTVVMGLIALIAVVGWRSHAEFRVNVWSRMLAILLLNALLGVVLPNIDNYGHAAGALCGAAVGLADTALLGHAERPGPRRAGLLGVLVLACCATAQYREDRVESARAARVRVVRDLMQVRLLYLLRAQRGADPRPVIPPRGPNLLGLPPLGLSADPRPDASARRALAQALGRLGEAEGDLGSGSTAEPYRRCKVLAARALTKPPTPEELRDFDAHFRPLIDRATRATIASRSPDAGRSRPTR